jgi:peptide deformylase
MNDNTLFDEIEKVDLTGVPLEGIPVPERHPMIYQNIEDFDFMNPAVDPIEFAHVLARTLISHNALGVSANQFGFRVRAFAMLANPIIVCYNPIIVDKSDETIKMDEGCLSFRNMILEKIERPRVIKVRYTEPNGNVVTRQFQDMSARIFQHELDHLNGIPFTRYVSSLKLEAARKDKIKRDRLEMLHRTTKPKLKV